MAYQPEQPTYDAGVYQYETTDPVMGGLGGIDNAPLLSLANRTAWLKQQVDALNTSIGAVAPLQTPAFSGTPTAPTPPAGDNTTRLATTAFVQETVSGIATVNVAGNSNVVLAQAQWGLGIILLTGAITGDISVIFPTQGPRWTVVNDTSGAFAITCKTAAGTGFVIPQGSALPAYTDGTNLNSLTSGFRTGDVKMTFNAVADPGWLLMNDGTIGNTTSGATARAATDTLPLFTLLWNNIPNSYAPVSGGRGATAAVDFAAGKTLQLTPVLGRALAAAGAGAGLTAYALGETVGENTHLLSGNEMPVHAHGVNDPTHSHGVNDPTHLHQGGGSNNSSAQGGSAANVGETGPTAAAATGISIQDASTGITIQDAGGGAAHNNMQPTTFLNVMVKL